MYTVTLLSGSEARGLDAALVESLRNAWGGGDAVWLNPDIAAEFQLDQVPDNRWDVWADVQNMGVDLVLLRNNRLEVWTRPKGGAKKCCWRIWIAP